MASHAAHGLHKLQGMVQGASSRDKKLVDLSRDTTDVHAPQSITTDHGTKVSDTDHWLKSVNGDQTGPSLLEDQIAREKVSRSFYKRDFMHWALLTRRQIRFIGLIMSVFLSE